MTLPWLKKKMNTSPMNSISIDSEGKTSDMSDDDAGLKAAAEDLLAAIKSDNAAGMAKALQACFELCDSMPHEEGPHEMGE